MVRAMLGVTPHGGPGHHRATPARATGRSNPFTLNEAHGHTRYGAWAFFSRILGKKSEKAVPSAMYLGIANPHLLIGTVPSPHPPVGVGDLNE